MKYRTYNNLLENINNNQYFVFGSNTQGRHGKGSALIAKQKFGAIYGVSKGFQGNSYAIITKDISKKPHLSISEHVIMKQIDELYHIAKQMKDSDFFIAYSGLGVNLNGYTPQEMANMFNRIDIPSNIIFEENFSKLLSEITTNNNKRNGESIEEWIDRIYKSNA